MIVNTYTNPKKIFNTNEHECSQILKEFKLNFNNDDLIFFEITNVFTIGEQENNDLKLIQHVEIVNFLIHFITLKSSKTLGPSSSFLFLGI
jgi:hypothetical protein